MVYAEEGTFAGTQGGMTQPAHREAMLKSVKRLMSGNGATRGKPRDELQDLGLI